MKRRLTAAILIGLAAIFIVSSFRSSEERGTTFSTKPAGAQAIFDFYLETGLAPQRWFYPFSELDPVEQNSMMLLVSPESMSGVKQLLSWISRGNRLVMFEGNPAVTAELREALHLKPTTSTDGFSALFNRDEFPSLPFYCPPEKQPICSSVGRISVQFPLNSYEHLGSAEVLVGYEHEAKAFLISHGEGEIWWFSGSSPALNENLDLHGNIALLFGLGESADRILIDEFHHGYTAPLQGEAARRTEIIYCLIACIFTWLFLGSMSRFIRFGPPTPPKQKNSSAGVDFVAVLGLLYQDRKAASLLQKYVKAWRQRLTHQLGVRADLPVDLLTQTCDSYLGDSRLDRAALQRALQELDGATDYSQKGWDTHIIFLETILKEILERKPDAKRKAA